MIINDLFNKKQGLAEGGIATVGWPDEGNHTGNNPPVSVGGTFDARPVVKRGSLVKASGLSGVYRVMDILRDEAKIVQEIPMTGQSTYVPMSDLRVWTNKPVKEQDIAEGSELKQAKRKYNQAAKDANDDQVGAGKKIDTMKKSLRQKDLNKQGMAEGSLEEVDRRGFLKGMGAAAVAGAAGGANADWERQQDFVDNLSGDKEIRFVNISPDSNYFLRFVSTGQGPVFYIGGLNFHLTKSGKGRIKIDNGKVHTISFVPTDDKTSLHTSKIQPLDVSITDLSKEIFSAKQKILIDVTEVTPGAPEERQRVATFIPKFSYKKESVEQGVAEGKKPDNYHIVNKDGKPASLASYADRASAEKDRDAKHPGAEVRQVGPRGKVKGVSEVSLGDYRKKAALDKALAQTDRFFGRDDPAAVAAADQTIAKRERGLARADARSRPYTPPAFDAEKHQRDLTAKYPNIDELVRKAELNRDPDYEMADGQAYYAARDAEQNYQKLRQIQRVIQGLNESLNRSHLP